VSIAWEEPIVETPSPSAVRPDSLAASVVILLVMTVAQRLIGFGRGILFCRWLDPEQLGQWDVAFGFLNLAAPLAVLGLPGSFGRYVEYFRARGQFHTFLRRTIAVSTAAGLIATGAIVVERTWFSQLIFGSDQNTGMVVWLGVCLAVVIAHNFLITLFIAVRMYRFVTALQFVQSLGFAALSIGLLATWPSGATSAVIAYAAATILSAVGSVRWLRQLSAGEVTGGPPVPQSAFWAKLLPFAGWMWVTNLLTNLFEVIDRYMIIHHGGMETHEALRQVGLYHSSRIVPLLFVAVASLLGSMITPHLSHDWERGCREAVVRRLNLVLKTLLYALFAGSIAVLFLAPLLFRVAFQNKFEGGLVVLPWTLAYCTWFGTIAVAQNYLWCAERPRLSSFALFAGLLLNVACNLVLLPRFGLEGAVWATSLANLFALTLIYIFSRWHGMHVDSGTWILTLAPVSLGFGPWAALCVLVVLTILAATSHRVLIQQEKVHLTTMIGHALRKFVRSQRQKRESLVTATEVVSH
jgi:PST family polysaccharide transporter